MPMTDEARPCLRTISCGGKTAGPSCCPRAIQRANGTAESCSNPMKVRNEGIENCGILPQVDINRLLGNSLAESDSFIVAKRARCAEPTKGFPMRVRQSRHPGKPSEESTPLGRSDDPSHADHWAAIEANLEKNPFHNGNTAGGRKPPYKPEYAIRAKALCDGGATTDELAEAFGISPKIVQMWQFTHGDFRKACALTPACTERVMRAIFDSAAAGNFGAAKYWDGNHQSEGKNPFTVFLQELSDSYVSRVGPRYRGPDGIWMSKTEHFQLGAPSAAEIDWSKKTPEEISQFKERLFELRRNS